MHKPKNSKGSSNRQFRQGENPPPFSTPPPLRFPVQPPTYGRPVPTHHVDRQHHRPFSCSRVRAITQNCRHPLMPGRRAPLCGHLSPSTMVKRWGSQHSGIKIRNSDSVLASTNASTSFCCASLTGTHVGKESTAGQRTGKFKFLYCSHYHVKQDPASTSTSSSEAAGNSCGISCVQQHQVCPLLPVSEVRYGHSPSDDGWKETKTGHHQSRGLINGDVCHGASPRVLSGNVNSVPVLHVSYTKAIRLPSLRTDYCSWTKHGNIECSSVAVQVRQETEEPSFCQLLIERRDLSHTDIREKYQK